MEYGGSTTKNGKSEMDQIIWNRPKWNTRSNYLGRMEYLIIRLLTKNITKSKGPVQFIAHPPE